MGDLGNVHLAGDGNEDDMYSGFNDYNPILDNADLMNDEGFQQAVARTSHGRRPMTGARMGTAAGGGGRVGTAVGGGVGRMTTAAGMRMASARPGTIQGGAARPMTAVRGAGYTSHGSGRTASFDPLKMGQATVNDPKPEENGEEKCKALEKKVFELLEDSILAYEKGNLKLALDKAKDAGRKERSSVKLRDQLNIADPMNLDITFSVLFNLAHQYQANDMHNEALSTYQVIVKNKLFNNAGRLKVNIGNIYFRKKDYMKAIKYYRMALDQVPNVQKEIRIKIFNNIGVAYVKLGKYDEAINTFDHCMEEKPEFRTALNLLLCAYTLEDREKMKDGFQRLIEIPLDIDDDDDKYTTHTTDPIENMITDAIKNDSMRQWEKNRRSEAERTILTAAKLISPGIASTFSDGYAWCVDMIKQSVYAELASDLEINKAIEYLRQGELDLASDVLKTFENKDSKVASAAANNLAFVNFLQGKDKLREAEVLAEKAIASDHYNPNALVNRGNISYAQGDTQKAIAYYKEALSNEASCVEALYNLGLTCKNAGKLEEALDCFYKLHNILRNNVQVLCQLGGMLARSPPTDQPLYESLEDTAQAMELYTQAHNLAPTDPGILAKLGELYDGEGDKSQAFQYHYDSYKYFPSNIHVIEWLGAYYIDAQFCEKAVNYFERASLMQPNEVKWQLMMASCHRRSGNYQKALDTYKMIHRRFPDNVECLKFLVRLCTDLGMPDVLDYTNKLKKVEKVRELREQRGSATGQRRSAILSSRGGIGSAGSMGPGRNSNSRGNLRSAGARINLDGADTYEMTNKAPIDTTYDDPMGDYGGGLGSGNARPKTGKTRTAQEDEGFENEEIDDMLLPD